MSRQHCLPESALAGAGARSQRQAPSLGTAARDTASSPAPTLLYYAAKKLSLSIAALKLQLHFLTLRVQLLSLSTKVRSWARHQTCHLQAGSSRGAMMHIQLRCQVDLSFSCLLFLIKRVFKESFSCSLGSSNADGIKMLMEAS